MQSTRDDPSVSTQHPTHTRTYSFVKTRGMVSIQDQLNRNDNKMQPDTVYSTSVAIKRSMTNHYINEKRDMVEY